MSGIAAAADVSRQLVYQQFGDRDTLLLEIALDLVRRDLLPHIADRAAASGERDRVLLVTRHFARHRPFYRAMMTGSCGFALSKALTGMLFPVNQPLVRLISRVPLDPEREADLATFVVGGWNALFSAWVIEAWIRSTRMHSPTRYSEWCPPSWTMPAGVPPSRPRRSDAGEYGVPAPGMAAASAMPGLACQRG